jgi:hypothetical protein
MIKQAIYTLAVMLVLAPGAIVEAGEVGVQVRFSDAEVAAIRAYYRHAGSPQVDGGKGKGHRALPPGIEKNLARGKPLPPGIAKQVLPAELIKVLPAVPRGYERIILGSKILLVEVATQVIHDVLEDVVLGHHKS